MQAELCDDYSTPRSHAEIQVPHPQQPWSPLLILYLAADEEREEGLWEILRGQAFHPHSTFPLCPFMFYWPELSAMITEL